LVSSDHPTAGVTHPAVFDSGINAGATLQFYLTQDGLFIEEIDK